jgi:predicted phosphodiesterase
MRTAVIADIHANLEALEAVLERIAGLGVSEIVCLGDIVGYNANPNECVDLVRDRNMTCVLGNHDACAAGQEEPNSFNPIAWNAMLWTRETLCGVNKSFLAQLRREQALRDCFLFHGSIHDTNRYLAGSYEARRNFRLLAQLPGAPRIGFFGHTHVMIAFTHERGVVTTARSQDLRLSPENRYLINPGSVGQPRDGDPRASFLVYDSDDRLITFHRIVYDIRICQDKIIRARLPIRLADRLAWGE